MGFTHRNRPGEKCLIGRITATLFHRGPDQQEVFVSPDISLGAVRLQVIDLHAGDQPLCSQDGHTVVAFNGEIYNHKDLRHELEAEGIRFRTHCDTEVVLEAFRRWDTACFARFRGMFAVALWCQRTKRLVLARDRAGIKPLYFTRHLGEIYFGSELKALFAHPNLPRVLDEEALEDFLSLNYVPGRRTLIRGIEKLPAGHYLEYSLGAARIHPYWVLDPTPDPTWTAAGAGERLDGLLRDSVREHLVADRPVGLWSSGGVDSSTILHYAAELSSRPLDTFSVGFRSRCCDESRYFREIASSYRTNHHELELSPGPDLISAIEDFAQYADEPNADAGALPVWFLSRMTANHVTVALSGDGGDELFGGYLTYMADRVSRPLRRIPASLRRGALALLQHGLPCSNRKISFEYKLKRLLEGSLLPADDAHLFWNGAFTPAEKRALLARGSSSPELFNSLPAARDVGFLNRYMLMDQQFYLPDNILAKVDRMSMAHSLEVRPAFLDHRIIEFAASLPQHLKISGLNQKLILKKLMKGKLPPSILKRSKKGFDIPTHDWFRGFLRPLLQETVNRRTIEETGIFNFAATERLIRDHMDRRINAGYQLWGLLTFFLWLRKWDVEVTPQDRSLQDSYAPALAAIN
ncbi:MAG: asparagine synthase (glutamine-hydrolyzing) [Acidobacteriota bacterium]|nr:asparagine synthase (glutamine-hydrolyzing) [Acidobacteriota bacterium]